MQPAEVGDDPLTGLEVQVERVAEHHVVAERAHVAWLEPADRALGRQRDEGGGAHRAVGETQQAGAGAPLASVDVEHAPRLRGALDDGG